MTKRVIDQYHNKSATEHLVNGSIVALVGTVFVVIASFLLKVVVARGVGSHGYGTLLLGLSIVMILSKFSSFAFNTTLSRQIPYHIEDKYKIIKEKNPDFLCLGYDQEIDENKLKEELVKLNLFPEIKRMNPYQEDKYKSSLIRNK